MPASRTSCTNVAHDGSVIGTGTPFEQTRPGTSSRLADSASASDAFSTACHPPKLLLRGSVAIEGSTPATGFTSAGFSLWGESTTLAMGYRTPRINWFRLARTSWAVFGVGDGDCATSG